MMNAISSSSMSRTWASHLLSVGVALSLFMSLHILVSVLYMQQEVEAGRMLRSIPQMDEVPPSTQTVKEEGPASIASKEKEDATPAIACDKTDSTTNEEPKVVPDIKTEGEPAKMTDSTNATVMGMAINYKIDTFSRFVGSLRNSGFKGNIILAVSPNLDEKSETYLKSKSVQYHKVEFVKCEHELIKEEHISNSHQREVQTCVAPYSSIKARWGRFPKLRDYLTECATCTGPVLVTDVRDTFFQTDPFGSGHPQVTGLQVFEEQRDMRTTNWLTKWPIKDCKGVQYDEPMLCSGTTIGTREAMLQYLDRMYEEMKTWMMDPKCHFKINGDDQSMHNYLFYSGQLPFAKAVKNRFGIVHTVGYQASLVRKAHERSKVEANMTKWDAAGKPFVGTTWDDKAWLGLEYDLIDKEGFLLNYDGSRSPVVHQYERFGPRIDAWLKKHSGLIDRV